MPAHPVLHHLRRNAVAYLALSVALGGTSYAAARLPRDSVRSAQIARNAVGSSELRNGAVRSPDIHNRGIRARDLAFRPAMHRDVNGAGASEAKEATIAPGADFIDVATVALDGGALPDGVSGRALIYGAVSVTNSPEKVGGASLLELRLVHDDHVDGGVFRSTVDDGASESSPIAIQCDGFRPGVNRLRLQARVVGPDPLTLAARTIDAVSFRPPFNPPTR